MYRTLMHATAEFYDKGYPVSGGTVTFYIAGTSTPKEVFSDFARTVSLGNIVTLDNQGRENIVLGAGNYDMEVRDADGVLLYTRQNITWDITAGGNAVLTTDTDVSGNLWVLDENSMVSNDPTKVPTQRSVKAYIDAEIANITAGDFQPKGQIVDIVKVTQDTYTLQASDAGKYIECQSDSPTTVTIPENTMSINDVVYIEQEGDGQVTVTGDNNVTVQVTAIFNPKTSGKYSVLTLVFAYANEPRLAGQLELA